MSELSDYERGRETGRVDALLDEHTQRLNRINGSVERHAKSNETLSKTMQAGFEKIAAEIRTMQEEARARELAVNVAAKTLAEETERRRQEISAASTSSDRRFTKTQQMLGSALALAALLVTIYFSTH